MSKIGKLSFLAAGISFALLYGARLVYGGWDKLLWFPLGFGLICLIIAFARDFKSITQFFTMKTTKHGMNMGAVILLALVGLTCINVLAVRYERKFDWTSEQLNSLSDQSEKAAKALKQETTIVLLYRNDQQDGENIQKAVRDLVDLYKKANPEIKFAAYNVLQRPDLAQKFEFNLGGFGVFATQGAERSRIEPVNEEGMTRALMKFGRGKKKILYFTTGHGERDLEGVDEEGLSAFKEELGVIYEAKPLSIVQNGNKIPTDASSVAIVRPQQQFLESELQAVREYVRAGGKVLVAIDPGLRHNLAQLTKSFGIEFTNHFVLDPRVEIPGAGVAAVLGTDFSTISNITATFSGQFAIFLMASSVKKAPESTDAVELDELVKSTAEAASVPDFKDGMGLKPNGPHVLAMSATGENGFQMIVFADSDFFANRLFANNLNKDLIMNSVASLMSDKDLISIRPKQPKGTRLEMPRQSGVIWVLVFLLPMPILLFGLGGYFWWQRRTA